MRCRGISTFIAVLAAAMVGSASASEPTDTFCDAPQRAQLARYVGIWTVEEWTYRVSPGEYATTDAKAKIDWALGGCAIREVFTGRKGEEPFLSEWTIMLKDGLPHQGLWIDSGHWNVLSYIQAPNADGQLMEFHWTHENKRLRLKFRYTEMSDDYFATERHMSPDAGETWHLVNRARYRRVE